MEEGEIIIIIVEDSPDDIEHILRVKDIFKDTLPILEPTWALVVLQRKEDSSNNDS